jgi:hypothetical protein
MKRRTPLAIPGRPLSELLPLVVPEAAVCLVAGTHPSGSGGVVRGQCGKTGAQRGCLGTMGQPGDAAVEHAQLGLTGGPERVAHGRIEERRREPINQPPVVEHAREGAEVAGAAIWPRDDEHTEHLAAARLVEGAEAYPSRESAMAQVQLQLLSGPAGQGMGRAVSERAREPRRHLGRSRLRIEVRHGVLQG